MKMRPTRRGYAVIAVVVGAVVAGAVFGARALDAVVLPGVVALVAAAIQLRRAPAVDLDRTLPPADVAGTAGTVTLELRGDRTYPVTLRDRLPAGVDAADPSRRRTAGNGEAVVDAAVGGDPARYRIVPQRRGEHTVGPATVVTTDVLGVLERSTVVDRRDTLITFPRIGTLPDGVGAELQAAYQSRNATRRDEFDDLREYVRGDSLRNIHWKSSARHDELMIQEFTDRADPERVTVAAGAPGAAGNEGRTPTGGGADDADTPADRMADVAATVCVSLVRGGASVALTTPSGSVDASPGRVRPALRHLAIAEGGRVPTGDADVVVIAEGGAVSVRFDGREHRLKGRIDDAVSLQEVSDRIGADAPPERPGGGVGKHADAVAPGAVSDRDIAPDGWGEGANGPERGDAE